MASTIYTYTKTGKALTVRQRSTPLEKTEVAKLVRARLDPTGGVSGRNVTVTNPAYSRRTTRTASLGMGAVGQRGRVMDVPGTI